MKIGRREFEVDKHTYICGILNVTPDSFSDGGEYNNIDAALFHAEKMMNEGADIIDIGGESTRPGAVAVSEEEEIARVIPVIEKIKSELNIPLSLDTYKAGTALAGIKAGVDMINDISGLRADERMASIVAASDVAVCLTHNHRTRDYMPFLDDFYTELSMILDNALKAGIPENRIILDPGIGFQKTTEENLIILDTMEMMGKLGQPWMLAASRKSVIGETLRLPTEERLEGTLATTALGVMKGASFVRVHDVKENKRLITMLEAVHGRN